MCINLRVSVTSFTFGFIFWKFFREIKDYNLHTVQYLFRSSWCFVELNTFLKQLLFHDVGYAPDTSNEPTCNVGDIVKYVKYVKFDT